MCPTCHGVRGTDGRRTWLQLDTCPQIVRAVPSYNTLTSITSAKGHRCVARLATVSIIRNAATGSRWASDTLRRLASSHAFAPHKDPAPQQATYRLSAPPGGPRLHLDARRGFLRDRATSGDALPVPAPPARPDLTHTRATS